MNKQQIVKTAELVSFDILPKSKKDEDLKTYVKRAYPIFESEILKSKNPVLREFVDDSKNEIVNAIGRLPVRQMLAKRWCQVNDPFELEAPKESTVDEILAHNKVAGSAKDLEKIMGTEAFEKYLNALRSPKRDGLTETQIRQKEIEHYARLEPLYPSEKSFSHGKGGTTRDYHWQSDLQELYLKDHNAFLSEFELTDEITETVKAEEAERAKKEAAEKAKEAETEKSDKADKS